MKHLNDQELNAKIVSAVADERKVQTHVLYLLREAERRMLHAKLGYSSLFEYCVQHLKYSEGSALRRINAMRLIQDLPEVKESIESGELSLSTASQLQSFFKKDKSYSKEKKRELVEAIKGKSKNETEKVLVSLNPEAAIPKEKAKPLSDSLTEIRFVANEGLVKKLEKLKGLMTQESYAELIEKMADTMLEKYEREPRKKSSPESVQSRQIPAAVKRQVWKRDGGRCTHIHEGRRCTSRYGLQIDHIKPFVLGGTSSPENLRLVCLAHNQLSAIQQFGSKKMLPFLSKLE